MMLKTQASDRYFFTGSAIFFILCNFIGFYSSTTQRLETGPIPVHVIVHGVSFAFWILMYGVQAMLISAKQQHLHKKIGLFSGLVLVMVFLTGIYTIYKLSLVLGIPLIEGYSDILLISMSITFAILGLIKKGDLFKHKRYMFYATLLLSTAGITRTVNLIIGGFGIEKSYFIEMYYGFAFMPTVLLLIYDACIYKRVILFDIIVFLLFVAVMLI